MWQLEVGARIDCGVGAVYLALLLELAQAVAWRLEQQAVALVLEKAGCGKKV